MKKYGALLISLVELIVSYAVIRYPLLSPHKMLGMPLYLLGFGAAVCIISGLVFHKRYLPYFTLAGYVLGFLCGCLFHAPYGPDYMAQDNLWILWAGVLLAAVLLGIAAEVLMAKRASV